MQIILVAIGSAGDVNPFVVIGSHLKSMGHEVLLIANPHFEDKAQRAGLGLLPLGTEADYQRAVKNPDVWKPSKGFAAVWQQMPVSMKLTYELIRKHQKGADTRLVGSTLAFGARLAQEKLGLKLATVHLAPACILSCHGTPQSLTHPMPPWFPLWLKSCFFDVLEFAVLDRVCAQEFNQYRKELGLPPTKSIVRRYIHSPDLVIGAFPEWFASVQEDWPKNSYTTGFPLYTGGMDRPFSEKLERFLASGAPPVVFTAGSAMAFSRPYFERAIEILQKSGQRGILVSAFPDQIPSSLPKEIIHIEYANFNELFLRAGTVVHHGGVGTSAMALASGCPQVIVPYAHDQFDNGLRMQGLGVGKMQSTDSSIAVWQSTLAELQEARIKDACLLYQKKILDSKPAEQQIAELVLDKLS